MAKEINKKNNEKETTDVVKKEKKAVENKKEVAKKSSKETTKKTKNSFFKDFKAELKKVVWPTPKEVANNTTAVIVIVLITTLLVFILDFGFEMLNVHGIDKLRSMVSSSAEENEAKNTITTEDVVVDADLLESTTTTENTVE